MHQEILLAQTSKAGSSKRCVKNKKLKAVCSFPHEGGTSSTTDQQVVEERTKEEMVAVKVL